MRATLRYPLGRATLVTSQGASMTLSEIRHLWALRVGIYPLKPGIDPEVDFERFLAWARASRVAQLCDRDGVVHGFWMARFETLRFQGRKLLVFMPEYVFVQREWRGMPWILVAGLECLLPQLPKLLTNSLYLAGTGYPTSIHIIASYLAHMWLPEDKGMPREAQAIFELLKAQTGATWDSAIQRVVLPTCPQRPSPSWYARVQHTPFTVRTLAATPQWLDGIGTPIVARIDSSFLQRAALRFMGRIRV